MTPSPPDEAIHFRGKSLTPESPRPLHIPEPSNIPVLENQMDPVFNDTSTYENLSSKQEDEGLSYRAAQENGEYQSANNIGSRNGEGYPTVREQGSFPSPAIPKMTQLDSAPFSLPMFP